jgi:hypothetical protein
MEPWDTPFNRATNAYKSREKWKPPTSAGRVFVFGTSMKVGEYYKSDGKKRKERKMAREKAEVEELRKKMQSLEHKVEKRDKVHASAVNKRVEERIRAIIPLG